jgi:hypothetical protein
LNNLGKRLFIGFIAFVLMLPFFEWYEAASYALVIFSLLIFLTNLAETIPVKELITLVASLQWLLGPVLDYRYFNNHYRYYMYVPEEVYFSYTIPAFLFFALGLLFLKVDFSGINQQIEQHIAKYPKLPFILLGIGFLIEYIAPFIPSSLRFVMFLITNLKYIGAIYLVYSPVKFKWHILAGIILFSFINSIALGLFHDILLWSVLIFIYVAYKLQFSFSMRLLVVVVGLLMASLIQIAKAEYRKVVWQEGFTGSEAQVFTSVLEDEIYNQSELQEYSTIQNIVIRLNQGWIISRVMYYVPQYEQYADGETVEEALYASFVPRLLNPDKKKAGGQENFSRFTGFQLLESTSMGTSVLGEAYANYGPSGGIVFMSLWGLTISLFFKIVVSFSLKKHLTLVLWVPLIFLQVIKAETELVVVLNHLVKAAIFVAGIYWLSYRVFKVQL